VAARHACRTERERAEALVVEWENREAERRKASIAACPHCDDLGMAQTEDTNGNSLVIRCAHDGPPPIVPAAEPERHTPPPPEVRRMIAGLGRRAAS